MFLNFQIRLVKIISQYHELLTTMPLQDHLMSLLESELQFLHHVIFTTKMETRNVNEAPGSEGEM